MIRLIQNRKTACVYYHFRIGAFASVRLVFKELWDILSKLKLSEIFLPLKLILYVIF